jgi:hypothetical protein
MKKRIAKKWLNLAYAEYNRTKGMIAFNLQHNPIRKRLNQHAIRYVFSDKSMLIISATKNYMLCKNTKGEDQAIRATFM